jgi:hypothetical protein
MAVAESGNSTCARVLAEHSLLAPLLYEEILMNYHLLNFDDDIYARTIVWYTEAFGRDSPVLVLAALRGPAMVRRIIAADEMPLDIDARVAAIIEHLPACPTRHMGMWSAGIQALLCMLFEHPDLLTTGGRMYTAVAQCIRYKIDNENVRAMLKTLRTMQYDIVAMAHPPRSSRPPARMCTALRYLLDTSGDAPAGVWSGRQHQAVLARGAWTPLQQRLVGTRARAATAALFAAHRTSAHAALRLGRALVDAHRLVPLTECQS